MKLKNLTGLRFGSWTVLSRGENGAGKRTRWICRCDCGTVKLVASTRLINGESTSCRCSHKSQLGLTTKYPHEYRSWFAAKSRCTNPNNKDFKRYGGRGINFSDEWVNDFPSFIASLGECPIGFTLERIDNDAGYSPSNCRWASRKEQAENRTDPRRVTL